MTDPYATVAENYDIMIDWPARLARERGFFEQLFAERPVRRVLDVGCGTGHHTRLFAELGAEAIGLDPSLPMLERARALTGSLSGNYEVSDSGRVVSRQAANGENPRFIEGGFSDLPTLPGPFDLIAVLGNTLAYVRDAGDLRQTLQMMRNALAPGGRLCIQTINYDNLPARGSRWLPLIHRQHDGREYLFLREYRSLGRRVEFSLFTQTRNGEWQQAVERSTHYPLTERRLTRALRRAGFGNVTLYGDYQQSPYTPTSSPNLIAIAEV